MANGLFIGWSSPVSPEQDEAFNTWYEQVHAPQVREAMPQVVSLRRFTVLGSGADGDVKRYVAVYEVADGDVAAAAAAMRAASKAGAFTMEPVIDFATMDFQFLVPLD